MPKGEEEDNGNSQLGSEYSNHRKNLLVKWGLTGEWWNGTNYQVPVIFVNEEPCLLKYIFVSVKDENEVDR